MSRLVATYHIKKAKVKNSKLKALAQMLKIKTFIFFFFVLNCTVERNFLQHN
jgi:hypothetical protein